MELAPYNQCMSLAFRDFRGSTEPSDQKHLVAVIVALSNLTGAPLPDLIETWLKAHRYSIA